MMRQSCGSISGRQWGECCCRMVAQRGPGCATLVSTSGDRTPFFITNVQRFPTAESAPAALPCGRLRMAGAYGFG
jgi:hypothetical protein